MLFVFFPTEMPHAHLFLVGKWIKHPKRNVINLAKTLFLVSDCDHEVLPASHFYIYEPPELGKTKMTLLFKKNYC